jgi:general secretion pathway protein G
MRLSTLLNATARAPSGAAGPRWRVPKRGTRARGFTLIELLTVLALVALLTSIAAPRYVRSLDLAREQALRTTLVTVRGAIDQFAADRGRWPESLSELIEARYLRAQPEDPITRSAQSWVELAATEAVPGSAGGDGGIPGISDLRSGAGGRGSDGSLYADW